MKDDRLPQGGHNFGLLDSMAAQDPSFEGRPSEDGKSPAARCREGESEIACMGFPVWKRAFDLACVLVSAPAWIPAMMLVAIWIRLVSPGPTFYRQERIGLRGRRFTILKFRSMKVNVETRVHEQYVAQLIQANCPMRKLDSAGDPRLILGGRLLRALGLDELPQILNVVWGDMSLVGPRPCTLHEFEHYQPWQRERVNVPPGLTGLWQVNGKNNTTFNEMIEMDLCYARNMSLKSDLRIVLKTFPTIAAQVKEAWKSRQRRNAHLSEPIAG